TPAVNLDSSSHHRQPETNSLPTVPAAATPGRWLSHACKEPLAVADSGRAWSAVGNSMKLSAILVSVNIAATVPIAAQAAEEAVSDKADWLKQNLASIDKTGKTEKSRISLSVSDVSARTSTIKLRPFVANRKLPSKRDIELQLSAQQARLDERNLASQA